MTYPKPSFIYLRGTPRFRGYLRRTSEPEISSEFGTVPLNAKLNPQPINSPGPSRSPDLGGLGFRVLGFRV